MEENENVVLENEPAAETVTATPPKKNKLALIIILAVLGAAIIAAGVFLIMNMSPKIVAERYAKALMVHDLKTQDALTAYDAKELRIYSYDGLDRDFFDAAEDSFDEVIDSWNDYYRVVKSFWNDAYEDEYGAYKVTAEATRAKKISSKKMNESIPAMWLDKLRAATDTDTVTDGYVVTVKAKLKGEDGTLRETYDIYLEKCGIFLRKIWIESK